MNTTTINDAETARKVADKIVTLMTSITEQESAQEREMNAVAARYATVIDTLKAELKELQAAFQKYLKKAANQKALFDEGNRSGHSTLATFGYRDSAPALKAMQGKLTDVAVAHKTGEDSGLSNDVGIVYAPQPFVICFAGHDTDVYLWEDLMRNATYELLQAQLN
jgi:hypothetical protein